MGNACSSRPKPDEASAASVRWDGLTTAAPGAEAANPLKVRRSVSYMPITDPALRERTESATKIQSLFRRHMLNPRPVSLRVAATQSWRQLPRGRDGNVLPLFSWSLLPLSYVQGVGNVLALRFELEYGLVFLTVFCMHYRAVLHNLNGDAITDGPVETPFPSAAGSLGNATSLLAAHGLGDALATIFLTFMTIALRRHYAAWQERVDDQLITVADYAVQFSGLPPTADSAQLSDWIRGNFFGVQLVGVTMVLDEAEVLRLMRKVSDLRQKEVDLTRSLIRSKNVKRVRTAALERKQTLSLQIDNLDDQLAALRNQYRPCVGIAFAVFNRINDSYQVIEDTPRRRYPGGAALTAQRASEPSDVQWENLYIGPRQQMARQSLGLLLSVAVTSFATVIMGVARVLSPIYADTEHETLSKILPPLFIVIGNLTINLTVPKIAEYEVNRKKEKKKVIAIAIAIAVAIIIITKDHCLQGESNQLKNNQ
ncbi:hypothetical protein T492DRAFT_549930 [Pavlovales sp. CCMP2436]|nr:hypothetical protein T492DRAFT_549930 [Pavlovales sp. CCMP2436]